MQAGSRCLQQIYQRKRATAVYNTAYNDYTYDSGQPLRSRTTAILSTFTNIRTIAGNRCMLNSMHVR